MARNSARVRARGWPRPRRLEPAAGQLAPRLREGVGNGGGEAWRRRPSRRRRQPAARRSPAGRRVRRRGRVAAAASRPAGAAGVYHGEETARPVLDEGTCRRQRGRGATQWRRRRRSARRGRVAQRGGLDSARRRPASRSRRQQSPTRVGLGQQPRERGARTGSPAAVLPRTAERTSSARTMDVTLTPGTLPAKTWRPRAAPRRGRGGRRPAGRSRRWQRRRRARRSRAAAARAPASPRLMRSSTSSAMAGSSR
jgi:hypothetical protein